MHVRVLTEAHRQVDVANAAGCRHFCKVKKSMGFKYEPVSEPLHSSVK